MKTEETKRLKSLLLKCAALLAAGIAYYIFIRLTGWAIPCPIKLITGKFCPGCGITRMFAALASLDFEGAVRCNILVLSLLVPAAAFAFRRAYVYVKRGNAEFTITENVLLSIAAIVTVAFWIMRNLPQFSFLAPI